MKNLTPGHSCRLRLRAATLFVAVVVSLNLSANELKFEQIFSDKGEPPSLHYLAEFSSKGTQHQLELWRDGERRLKRRTDDSVEIYAFRKPDDSEFRLSILDLKRHIHTRVDRTNLYRIGNFTDWFDLAHGLKHPKGVYQLVPASAPQGETKPLTACQWYDLTQQQRTTHVCWSLKKHIPMIIQAQNLEVLWRVTALDQKPVLETHFVIHDEGFVQNDANQDIEND